MVEASSGLGGDPSLAEPALSGVEGLAQDDIDAGLPPNRHFHGPGCDLDP